MRTETVLNEIKHKIQFVCDTKANIHQHSYHDSLWTTFESAYNKGLCGERSSPQLTGDRIYEHLTRHFKEYDFEDNKKMHVVRTACSMWDEWRYAWDRAGRREEA